MLEYHTQDEPNKEKAKLLNDFTYSVNDHSCPLNAHIRKTNPRTAIDRNTFTRCDRTKMIRNGIPYGSVGDAKVGLLFACYQAHIEDSFQEMQARWSNESKFQVENAGIDPIIGQVPQVHGSIAQISTVTNNVMTTSAQTPANIKELSFNQFVTMRGGEYFFVPSIPALRNNLGQA
jgi:deferrochelatase/peroxidase EfeB